MRTLTALALTLIGTAVATAAPDGWHTSMKDGVAAARKSGKPLLVITLWGDGV